MNTHVAEIKDVEPGPVVEIFLEDIEIGRVREAGPITVTADEIISFATRYDPLPMHISDEGGVATVHDSLIASGVLTIALKQRMIMSIERNAAIIGAAKIEDQNFLKPVRAGDELSMRQECVGKRESKTRSDRGLAIWEFELTNQHGETVFSSRDIVMVRRRPV
ncbi:MAG: MaoC/PaaZ C-terminal domain-containing protein [Alphaproteobacteria bacterium]